MMLLTKEIRKRLPPLYSQEGKGYQAIAQVKFFCPWNRWTWYASEFDGENEFFGLEVGDADKGLTYFTLSELQKVHHWSGLRIERDMHFTPCPLEQCRKMHES